MVITQIVGKLTVTKDSILFEFSKTQLVIQAVLYAG